MANHRNGFREVVRNAFYDVLYGELIQEFKKTLGGDKKLRGLVSEVAKEELQLVLAEIRQAPLEILRRRKLLLQLCEKDPQCQAFLTGQEREKIGFK